MMSLVDDDQIKNLSNEFGINLRRCAIRSIQELELKETPADYTIKFSTTKKIDNYTYDEIMRLITSGNLSTKRFMGFHDILEYVADNISILYKEWHNKWR